MEVVFTLVAVVVAIMLSRHWVNKKFGPMPSSDDYHKARKWQEDQIKEMRKQEEKQRKQRNTR